MIGSGKTSLQKTNYKPNAKTGASVFLFSVRFEASVAPLNSLDSWF